MNRLLSLFSGGSPELLPRPIGAAFLEGLCRIFQAGLVFLVVQEIYRSYALPDHPLDLPLLWKLAAALGVWTVVQYGISVRAYDATFTAAILNHCTFEKTSNQLMFVDCEILDCVFRGQLGTLAIDGRGHRYPIDPSAISADFGDAVVREFYIQGYRLDQVRLPKQEDIVVLHHYPSVLRAAAEWLKRPDATESELRWSGAFDYFLNAPGAENSDYCFDLNGYGDPELITAVPSN